MALSPSPPVTSAARNALMLTAAVAVSIRALRAAEVTGGEGERAMLQA